MSHTARAVAALTLLVLLVGLPPATATPGTGPADVTLSVDGPSGDAVVLATTETFDPMVSVNLTSSAAANTTTTGQVRLRNPGSRDGSGTLTVRVNGSTVHETNVTLAANETHLESVQIPTPADTGPLNVTATYADAQAQTTVSVIDPPPTAVIDQPFSTAQLGEPTEFAAVGSDDNDKIVKYSWCFGDGACGLGASETHTYDAPGTYNVTLTVVDSAGQRDTTSRVITVDSDREPTAHLDCTGSLLVAGETVTCDASGSSDDDQIVSYQWQFIETMDDGSTTSTRTVHRGTGVSERFTYSSPGVYAVELTVVDKQGNTDTTQQAITVEPAADAPDAGLSCTPTETGVGESITCSAAASTDDDFLTEYEWNFDDGATGTGETHTHTYTQPGVYRVNVTVRDTSGLTDTATQVVSVGRPQAPNAVMACSPTTTPVGERVTCTATTSNDDATITAYEWDFGDDSRGRGMSEVHTYDDPGVYPITLTVTDADGRTDTARTTIAVTNDPVPIADFTYQPKPPSPGDSLQFNASDSSDGESAIARYEWDFNGDGAVDATGPQASRAFDAGPRVVSLTVIDEEGYRSSTEQLLTITSGSSPPPTTRTSTQSAPSDDDGILLGLGIQAWTLLGGLLVSLIGLSYRRLR